MTLHCPQRQRSADSTGHRPSLREVAAATLRSALAELYPDLDIDPNLAILVTPRWQSVSGEVVPDLPHLQSLAGALARSALTNVALTWIDGEHYLINQTQEQANTHVSVQVDRIAQLINELAPCCLSPTRNNSSISGTKAAARTGHAGRPWPAHCATSGMYTPSMTGTTMSAPWPGTFSLPRIRTAPAP